MIVIVKNMESMNNLPLNTLIFLKKTLKPCIDKLRIIVDGPMV